MYFSSLFHLWMDDEGTDEALFTSVGNKDIAQDHIRRMVIKYHVPTVAGSFSLLQLWRSRSRLLCLPDPPDGDIH